MELPLVITFELIEIKNQHCEYIAIILTVPASKQWITINIRNCVIYTLFRKMFLTFPFCVHDHVMLKEPHGPWIMYLVKIQSKYEHAATIENFIMTSIEEFNFCLKTRATIS